MSGTVDTVLGRLCREYTRLGESDICRLDALAANLSHIASLVEADMFIDCLCRDGGTCLVVAEAGPGGAGSMYSGSVIGKQALAEREPAVYEAFRTGTTVRDLIAVTQENRTVSQAVAPVRNAAGSVIAVLIQEKDVSASVQRDKKYAQLVELTERQREQLNRLEDRNSVYTPAVDDNRLAMREIHHRVKNNLQLVASMLGIQARNADAPAIRHALRENVNRILSIASVYDALALQEPGEEVRLLSILRKVGGNASVLSADARCRIEVTVDGEDLVVCGEKATYIALIVNELVMNAFEHAFTGRDTGQVAVRVGGSNHFITLSVWDDGTGFDSSRPDAENLGLNLVRSMVCEKLGGTLRLDSDGHGTRVFFDFRR